MRPALRALSQPLAQPAVLRLLLCVLFALAAGFVAYQAPAAGTLAVGWLGDRLFLQAESSAAAADSLRFYADELTPDAPGQRSRWTRGQALLHLPGLGPQPLSLALAAQGWPSVPAGQEQPLLTISAAGQTLGRFQLRSAWQSYQVVVPATAFRGGDLELLLATSQTFTDSLDVNGARIADARPKGLRLAQLRLQSPVNGLTRLLAPDWPTLGWLMLAAALCYLGLHALLRQPNLAFVLTVLLVAGAALALALARLWAAALLPYAPWAALLLLLVGCRTALLRGYGLLLRRYSQGSALGYGLLVAALAWLMLTVVAWIDSRPIFDYEAFWSNFPDSLLYSVLVVALLALTLLQSRNGLPRALAWLQQRLLHGRLALILLLALGGTWLGYQALLLRDLPAIGHADYADNGVVARNLLAGRGYVVDYVTQYYQLYNGGASVTRPQETWPLLQPLWILPFFSAFGASAWAARLPNLVFNGLLIVLIYNIGERLWDRRVGLCAALLVLTNTLFFNMTIYATSDLAFVVFATAAIYCLYLACAPLPNPAGSAGRSGRGTQRLLLIAAGLFSGLMLLQRPSAALIAAGMGCWLLEASYRAWRVEQALRRGAGEASASVRLRSLARHLLVPALLWGGIALALLAPYLVRNMLVFGQPFKSTESYDAWVIDYAREWDDIYYIYVPDAPLNGPGVPERSWILRWGFDTTLRKIEREWALLGNLLLPAWQNGPLTLATKPEDSSITLLHTMGGWLALASLPLLLWRRPQLLSLLALAFSPYLLFLVGYWHVEERYLPLLVPWLALLGVGLLWKLYDRLAALHGGRWSGLALALVVGALLAVARPSWPAIAEKIHDEPLIWAPDLEAYQWLRTLPPDTVVMSRGPWQLNFYSERPALMLPNTDDVDKLLYIASYYRARYLLVETTTNTGKRGQQALQQLTIDRLEGEGCVVTPPGTRRPERRLPIAYCSRFYELADGSRYQTVVYRFPDDYGGAAAGVAR